jgi:SAM-dependent methyltransferase
LRAEVVQRGEIETVTLPKGTADVVVFCDVIEHVRDPRSFLDLVHSCLRPGGLVFAVTPSTDSWSRRLMGERWMEYKTEHLFYFSRRSLDHLLKQHGFGAIEFHPTVKSLSFDYVRAHFRRFQVPFWSRTVELAGRMIPSRLARREFRIAASGITAMARKSA